MFSTLTEHCRVVFIDTWDVSQKDEEIISYYGMTNKNTKTQTGTKPAFRHEKNVHNSISASFATEK